MFIHPPDPNALLFTDDSLGMESSSRADETIISWSLDGRPIPAPYQYSRNNAHSFCTEESHTIRTSLCVMISTDNIIMVLYINKQEGTHSADLCMEVWEILHWCLKPDIVLRIRHIPGKFNILADSLSRLNKPLNTEWSLDQSLSNFIFQMLNFPNVDLFANQST